MKKLLSLVLLTSLSMAAASQNIEGYYRVQNASSSKYISIVNNKVDETTKSALKSGGGGTILALRMKSQEEIISDPGSITYMKKGSSGYILEGQGMNTYNLTSLYLNLFTGKQYRANGSLYGATVEGGYWMFGTASGATRYLFDSMGKDDTETVDGKIVRYSCVEAQGPSVIDINSAKASWFFKPIDNTTEYFAFTPEITAGDKYYTTICCSFPIKLADGMKAYYIKECKAGATEAQILEVTNGIIPVNTPVIVECSSNNPSDNKVTLLTSTEAGNTKVQGNILSGNYFSYVKMKTNGKDENTGSADIKSVIPVTNDIRVLGVSNGQLALVKPTDDILHVTNQGKYLPANKAYLELKGAANIINLTTEEISGINIIKQGRKSTDIFNLQGQKVADKNTTVEELPRGIYIINGKKVIRN